MLVALAKQNFFNKTYTFLIIFLIHDKFSKKSIIFAKGKLKSHAKS